MLSNFFIRRPIVAIVIAILTVIIGLVSMVSLPISQYPDIVPPEIQVQATYPGADAKTLEQSVSTPLEEQMNGVDNMIYMQSVNANNGQATLYVDFDVKTDPEHRSGSFAAPRLADAVATSPDRQRRRRHRSQVPALAAAVHQPQLASRQLRSGLPHQLRRHQSAGRDHPRQRRQPRADLRRPVRHPRLGQP